MARLDEVHDALEKAAKILSDHDRLLAVYAERIEMDRADKTALWREVSDAESRIDELERKGLSRKARDDFADKIWDFVRMLFVALVSVLAAQLL